MEETTYICERCGERVPADACTMVADTILCRTAWILIPQSVIAAESGCSCRTTTEMKTSPLCERCFERHYTHCERCGRVISYSDAYYEDDEDEPLCYDCLQARLQQAIIHDYSYTPRLIFHGERGQCTFLWCGTGDRRQR